MTFKQGKSYLRILSVAFSLLMCFFIFSNRVNAQETIQLQGKVLDGLTSQPVPFASIGIIGKPMGTVTNMDGRFEFNFSNRMLSDTLFVSNLGYYGYKIALRDIKNYGNFFIVLQPRVYNIQEVVVSPEGTDAKEIVQKAYDSLVKNTSSVPFISEGFYREYIQENGIWSRAIEASLSVYSDGKQHIGDYFYPARINGIRSSKNYLSAFAHSENYNQITLFLTSTLDVKWFIMGMDNMKFQVDSMIYLDNKLIWVISAKPLKTVKKAYFRYDYEMDKNSGKIERVKKKMVCEVEKNTDFFYRYRYYITDSNFAFVKTEYIDTAYRPIFREDMKTKEGFYISYTTTKKVLEYINYKDLWYPHFLREHKEIGYFTKKDSNLYMNVVKHSDFLVNTYQTELVTEIPKAQEIRNFKDIYNQGYIFDHTFWSNYNIIADDHLRKQVFTDLRLSELEKDPSAIDLYLAMKDSIEKAALQEAQIDPYGMKDTTVTDINEAVLADLYFTVQISAGKTRVALDHPDFKGLKGVEMYEHGGMYKYTYGKERSLNSALAMQKQLLAMGFKGAFIVPFYKGERITLDQGVALLNSVVP
jgi:hypothetical protein